MEGSVSTVTPDRGEAVSPPESTRHLAAVSAERPHFSRFRSVRRMPLPRRKRISRRPSSREKILGSKWSGCRWLAHTSRGFSAGRGGSSPFHQSKSRHTPGSSARKPLWSRKVTVIP